MTLRSLQPFVSALLAAGLMACGSAEAMAKKPVAETSAPQSPPVSTITGSGDYQNGYEYGHRNGTLISQRLRDATLGQEGCAALSKYQRALTQVAKNVRPPRSLGLGKDIAKGFFRGYLDAVRASIEDARRGCDAVSFEDGQFAGEFYGSLLCSAASSGLEAYAELEAAPLYEQWAAGSVSIRDQCIVEANAILADCATDLSSVQSATELHVNVSCAD